MTRITENWLTQKPKDSAFIITILMTALHHISGFIFLSGLFQAQKWMPAKAHEVFINHELWRPWSALFAHADLGHLINNSILFLPLTYLLTSYFGVFLFPFLGLALGGLINLWVLRTLPAQTSLIGMSGVVYWMGAVWLTLFVLIDTRKSLRRRLSVVLFLTVVLLAPQTYEPTTSYLSHLLGFIVGIFSALIYYFTNRQKILAAEIKETIFEDPEQDFQKIENSH